jgi:RNA polymerase sigma factor (sigma-70 family)
MADARSAPLLVYVVDDDASIRDSLSLLLGLAGYAARLYPDAESFLAEVDERAAGCVVADLRLPGISGLELQAKMRERGSRIPFVIITAHGDVPAARAAFRADAVDFIEKPFEAAQLKAAVESAFERERALSHEVEARRARAEMLGRLTPREREVLDKAAQGLHAREIGDALGISPRTVEVHKMRLMEKLGVRNVAELVRFALEAEQGGNGTM